MEKPNVLWIALESVRYDHTSLGGYKRDTTPALVDLSQNPESRSFDLAFSSGIYTRSSTASILTGTYPSRHGLGIYHTQGKLPSELETVPEILGRAGYQTACLSPNPHITPDSGLDRGFDEFRYFRRGHLRDATSLKSFIKYILNLRKHSAGFTTETRRYSTDYLMDLEAKKLINRHNQNHSPYFLYIHHGDTHCPYSPPLPHRDEYTDEIEMNVDSALEVSDDLHANLYEHLAAGAEFSNKEWEGITAMYDAAIKYSDRLVGELVSHVLDRAENTIIVISGDHGELLGEQNLIEHRFTTHDAVSHVPLVVYGSDAISGTNSELVQHIDIIRTILEEEIGITDDQLQGHNLAHDSRDFAIIQRGYDRYRKTLDRLEGIGLKLDISPFHNDTVHAARTEEYKLVKSDERTELFELPDESTDVSNHNLETVEHLSEQVDMFLENEGEPVMQDPIQGEMSAEVREHLSELGYLSK